MSKRYASTARNARRAPTPAVSPRRSKSPVTAVTVTGWDDGFDKAGFTALLRESGMSLRDAFDATARVLDGVPVRVPVPSRAAALAFRARLSALHAKHV